MICSLRLFLLKQGLSEPEFYGDLVYKFRKYFGCSVGNHVIFVMIHCTERWRRFAPDRILSKGKQHFPSVFSIFIQRVIYHFPAHISPDLMIPGYCQKDPYFQQRQNLMRRKSRLKYRDYLHGRQIVFIILSAWRVFRSQIRRQITPLESQIPKISILFT